jgi:uridine phosphorylase
VLASAVRDEDTSEEYISKEYPAAADYRVVRALLDACRELGRAFRTGTR